MKKLKILMSLMLIVACTNPSYLYAKDGDVNGLSDEGEIYVQSDEYQKRIQKKDEWVEKQLEINMYRRTGRLGVPHYTQKTNKYCGPTSMKMVVEFVTGQVYSQDYLAKVLGTGDHGTYVDVLTNQLRAYAGLAYELGMTANGNFFNNVKADFDAGYPVIYDVNASKLDPFYKGFTPHFIVGDGYESNGELYYCDPGKGTDYNRSASQSKIIEALNENGGYYVY